MSGRPVTLSDLARVGKLLEIHCSARRPERHLFIDPLSLGLPRRTQSRRSRIISFAPKCGSRNTPIKTPISAMSDARIAGVPGALSACQAKVQY